MKTVWKFPLRKETTEICAPVTKFLTVQDQGGIYMLWTEVETLNDNKRYDIRFYGTGHEIDDGFQYIATVQDVGGLLIWHAYYKEAI